MIFLKTVNESAFFSVFYHRLKFWTLNFNAPQLLQKTFVPHGFLFNNVYLHVYYHSSTFVGLVAKYPVYLYICISQYINKANFLKFKRFVLFINLIVYKWPSPKTFSRKKFFCKYIKIHALFTNSFTCGHYRSVIKCFNYISTEQQWRFLCQSTESAPVADQNCDCMSPDHYSG